MSIFKLSFKIIGQIIFVIMFFSTIQAKNLDRFNKEGHISDYFSGILLLNDNQYSESLKFLKKLDGLEKSHVTYSVKYLYSLVNSGNLKSNTLKIKKDNGYYKFYINDNYVYQMEFENFYGNDLGFVVYNNQEIAVDYLRVKYMVLPIQ